MLGALSGNLASVNFVHSAGRPYVRRALRRADQRSQVQLQRRARFLQVTTAWQDLSQENRDAWVATATNITFPNRFGIHRHLSGYQLFVRYQMQLVGGVSIDLTPPQFATTIPAPYDVSLTASAGGDVVANWTNDYPPGIPLALFFGARSMRSSPSNTFHNWRYLTASASPAGAHNKTLTTWWDSALGHPFEHERIAIAVQIFHAEFFPSTKVPAYATTAA